MHLATCSLTKQLVLQLRNGAREGPVFCLKIKRALCLLLICLAFMTAAEQGSAAQPQPLTEEEAFRLGVDAYILNAGWVTQLTAQPASARP